MSVAPLFFEPEPFEKTAGEVDLSEDPNAWPQEILQELYKQVPYIADYQPHVQMQKVDGEQGYGIGHVEIQNQTEAAPDEVDGASMDAAGIRTVRIPFIIKGKKLSPFDILINDASFVLPLTENRLRQAIFRPQTFDVTSKTPGDQSMIGQLYPPIRHGFGGYGGSGMYVGSSGSVGKMASALEEFIDPPESKQVEKKASKKLPLPTVKEGSVLDAILPTINVADHNSFCTEVEKRASDIAKYARTAVPVLSKVVNATPEPLSKIASWEKFVRPTVVQIQRSPSGYTIKEASHLYWEPTRETVGRGEIVERFGTKIAADVDMSGAVTITDGADAQGGDTEMSLQPVQEFGLYKVRDESGKEHVGFVIPELIDTDGSPIPLQLFSNGSISAVQAEILGEQAGAGGNLPSGPIGGHGAFYKLDAEGKVNMTIPFELDSSSSMPGEPTSHQGVTFDGRPVEVSVQPNIATVVGMDDKVLIPQDWLWLPLAESSAVALVGGDVAAVEGQTDEEFTEKESHVVVRGDTDMFSFSGTPVEKLAREDRTDLDVDSAMFLLAGLGTHQGYGAEKLAMAAYGGQPVSIKTGRAIELKAELLKNAHAQAASFIQSLPQLKQPHLVKEATSFPDPVMVDTVLSLGFINPENIMTFISYLPSLEDTQSKLCEMLLSVRLGLQNVPQTALERAVRSLEEVTEGLKILAFQGT